MLIVIVIVFLIDGTTINEQTDKSNRRVEKKQESSENAVDEWNTYNSITIQDSPASAG